MFRAILRGVGAVLSALGNLYLGAVDAGGLWMDRKIREMEETIERRDALREVRERDAQVVRWLIRDIFAADEGEAPLPHITDPVLRDALLPHVVGAQVVLRLHKQVERLRERAEAVAGGDTAGCLTARHLRDRAKEVERAAEVFANLSEADLQRLCREAHNQ